MIDPKIKEAWRMLADPIDTEDFATATAVQVLRHAYVHAEAMQRKAEWDRKHDRVHDKWDLEADGCPNCSPGDEECHNFTTDVDWEAELIRELQDD